MHLTASFLNNRLLIVGGDNGPFGSTFDIYSKFTTYFIHNNTWSSSSPMPTKRACLASVAINDKFFVLGGNGKTETLSTIEAYGNSPSPSKPKKSSNISFSWKIIAIVFAACFLVFLSVLGFVFLIRKKKISIQKVRLQNVQGTDEEKKNLIE